MEILEQMTVPAISRTSTRGSKFMPLELQTALLGLRTIGGGLNLPTGLAGVEDIAIKNQRQAIDWRIKNQLFKGTGAKFTVFVTADGKGIGIRLDKMSEEMLIAKAAEEAAKLEGPVDQPEADAPLELGKVG